MKTKVNDNVNQTGKKLSLNAGDPLVKILELARSCKEKQEANPSSYTYSYIVSQEDYEFISKVLRLTGNEDIPISAYVEAVVHDFRMTHDEDGIRQFTERIIKRRK